MKCPHQTTVKASSGALVCADCGEKIAAPPPTYTVIPGTHWAFQNPDPFEDGDEEVAANLGNWMKQETERRILERIFSTGGSTHTTSGAPARKIELRRLGSGKVETYWTKDV